MKELNPPSEGRENFDKMKQLADEQLERVGELLSALDEGQMEDAARLMQELDVLEASSDFAAKGYGLKDCAKRT